MIRKVRKLIPHSIINYSRHLPQAVMANVQYGFPSKKIRVVGVTGTDGKTTTVNMIYQILKDAGKRVSMISTINAVIAGKSYDTGFHVTNPSSKDVQKFLKQAVEAGDEFMVLEVTSHGLSQFRVWGINFEIGVITNVTHEHLDYHKTFDNYLKAKLKLLRGVKIGIINMELKDLRELEELKAKIITFGLNKGDYNRKIFPVTLKIPGEYNLENALAAAATTSHLGVDKQTIKRSLENFATLSGRMEEIKNSKGIKIYVDFAHTPNALENALRSLREQTKGKIISVFGAASERDKDKRPMMGNISAKFADVTVLTDEDPRFEDRTSIIEEIAIGAYKAGAIDHKTLFKEPDRAKAINLALSLSKKGDVIGIFGKGHEKSMNDRGIEKQWSDQRSVLLALKNLKS